MSLRTMTGVSWRYSEHADNSWKRSLHPFALRPRTYQEPGSLYNECVPSFKAQVISFVSKTVLLSLGTGAIKDQVLLCCGDRPVRVGCSATSLVSPTDARSSHLPPVVTTENDFRHCPLSPGGQAYLAGNPRSGSFARAGSVQVREGKPLARFEPLPPRGPSPPVGALLTGEGTAPH